jgi:Domain of unknown function (DUF1917)
MVFAPPSKIDSLWAQIARATYAGTLGIAAKVSPRNGFNDADSRDYTDSSDAYKVRSGLRRLGVKWTIGYKPDIDTHCDIYRKHTEYWGIAPTRYYS